MPGTKQSPEPRVIVIPRQLQDYFYERLTASFAGRDDIRVMIDRRTGERRQTRWAGGEGPPTERRRGERRAADIAWSLPDMPFVTS